MYRVSGDGVKDHYCTNYYLAQLVADNLKERYETEPVIEDAGNYSFKYIGWMWGNQEGEEFSLSIPDVEVSCSYSDWPTLKDDIEKRLRDPWRHDNRYDSQFYKLHSAVEILCFTKQQRDLFLRVYDTNKDVYDKIHSSWSEDDT